MAANGSPPPVFETDDERAAFVIRLPVHAGALVAADQVTGVVTGEVERLLRALNGEMSRKELQQALGLKHEEHFRDAYLVPALRAGLVGMTWPDKPTSRLQRYRLTALGQQHLRRLKGSP